MTDQRNIAMIVAAAFSEHMSAGAPVQDCQWGQDDNHLFIRVGEQVFRVRVEEVGQISAADPLRAAKDFMLTLPYGPDA